MKTQYRKLKVKLTALVLIVLVLGCSVLTYQKADTIRTEYIRLIHEQIDFVVPLRWSADEMGERDMILQTYDAFCNISTISGDVGFYSMLKNADGNTLAENQNFVIIRKIEDNEEVDKRVILLGMEYVSDDKSIQHTFAGAFFSGTEIKGTCDDIYIYLEELKWERFMEGWYSYRPEDTKTELGTMSFEQWAGKRAYHEDWGDNAYYVSPSFAVSLYGDWELNEKRNAEAKEICEQIYSDFVNDIDTIDDQRDEGIFTCFVGGTGYLSKEYTLPFVFVFHPVSMAMEELAGMYFLIGVFGVMVILFMWFTINKVYQQQLAYENNRRKLTRGIAHELKTPLAITKGYVDNWVYMDEENRSKAASVMVGEIDYMNRMVTDLLELSRLEAKAKELHVESVDVVALTQSVLKRMQDSIKGRELEVRMSENAHPEIFLVTADLEMMRSVLVNYISNAVKYAEKNIHITFLQRGSRVRFEIENDGKAIEKDRLDKVWDEFYKGERTDNTHMESSGLGLAIAKNILLLHEAKYGCNSQAGKTVFWFEMKAE